MQRRSVLRNCSCGDGLPAIAQSPSLSGFQGFFRKYVPVFLTGKNVYRIKKFKRGAKKTEQQKLYAGIV